MSKNKCIVTVKHGRPSTLLAFSTMNSGTLIQRRQVFKGTNPRTRVLKRTYYRVYKNNDVDTLYKENKPSLENSIVVRWGSREDFETDKNTIVYNKSANIKDATDKKKSRELFIENKVSCPMLVTDLNIDKVANFPIIARPLVHSKGKNFVTLDNRESFLAHYNKNKNGWYYSDFINKNREFRIHVAHGKALAIMEKTQPGDGNIAWNRAQNDTDPFIYIPWGKVDEQELGGVIKEALKAVEAVGLDFGGVDVMLKGKTPYVLEVNTSPTLNSSPYVAERWGKYFDWLFRENKRRDHWDTSDFKKGSSLIWKNFQLADEKTTKRS